MVVNASGFNNLAVKRKQTKPLKTVPTGHLHVLRVNLSELQKHLKSAWLRHESLPVTEMFKLISHPTG